MLSSRQQTYFTIHCRSPVTYFNPQGRYVPPPGQAASGIANRAPLSSRALTATVPQTPCADNVGYRPSLPTVRHPNLCLAPGTPCEIAVPASGFGLDLLFQGRTFPRLGWAMMPRARKRYRRIAAPRSSLLRGLPIGFRFRGCCQPAHDSRVAGTREGKCHAE
jgi:hypothetical protein